VPTGRFAPSPTGPLHVGNLRTALLAWLCARRDGARFLLRVEDLDRAASRPDVEAQQLADLEAIGLDWDGPVVHQSRRTEAYDEAIERLDGAGLLYPCYCTRREIQTAAQAPHGAFPEGAYPGTCRQLTAAQRAEREAAGRPPALRIRAEGETRHFADLVHGEVAGVCDDFVIRRNDGVAAYNLAVVLDDADAGVEEVVRGDDLLLTTPRQVLLQELLELPSPVYVHVPLVLGPDGERLAKRHGAVTLADIVANGMTEGDLLSWLLASLGLTPQAGGLEALSRAFSPTQIPRATVTWPS
jgi:glutamyl-tRNA synthetase